MSEQSFLFGKADDFEHIWEEEWHDMPEFKHIDIKPYQEIIVRFNSETDVENFAKLIKQTITCQTKSLYVEENNKECQDR